jgi:hypothetical protein
MIYADPRRKRYKLATRQQVHAAIAHFASWQRIYPRAERSEIARRIKARAKKLGIHVRAF